MVRVEKVYADGLQRQNHTEVPGARSGAPPTIPKIAKQACEKGYLSLSVPLKETLFPKPTTGNKPK